MSTVERRTPNIGPFSYDGVNNSGTITVAIAAQDVTGHLVTRPANLTYADRVHPPR